MFRYIKQYAESTGGISIYPIISLLIFFVFFIVLLYYVKKMDKNMIRKISHIPLDPDDKHDDTITKNNYKQAPL